jgi:hypothetical protein
MKRTETSPSSHDLKKSRPEEFDIVKCRENPAFFAYFRDKAAEFLCSWDYVAEGSEIPPYWRQRSDLVQSAARHIQRIQKALTQMNLPLANGLSDLNGKTGQAIIKAILAGESAIRTSLLNFGMGE